MCGTSAEYQSIYLEIWVENSGRDKTHLDKPKRIFFIKKYLFKTTECKRWNLNWSWVEQ